MSSKQICEKTAKSKRNKKVVKLKKERASPFSTSKTTVVSATSHEKQVKKQSLNAKPGKNRKTKKHKTARAKPCSSSFRTRKQQSPLLSPVIRSGRAKLLKIYSNRKTSNNVRVVPQSTTINATLAQYLESHQKGHIKHSDSTLKSNPEKSLKEDVNNSKAKDASSESSTQESLSHNSL